MSGNKNEKERNGKGLIVSSIIVILIAATLVVLTYIGVIPKMSTLVNSTEPELEAAEDAEPFSVIFEIEELRDWDITTVYFDTTEEAAIGRNDIYFATRGAEHDNNDYYVTCEEPSILATVKYSDIVEREYDDKTYNCGRIFIKISEIDSFYLTKGKPFECHLIRKTEPEYNHTFYIVLGSEEEALFYKECPEYFTYELSADEYMTIRNDFYARHPEFSRNNESGSVSADSGSSTPGAAPGFEDIPEQEGGGNLGTVDGTPSGVPAPGASFG